MTNIKFAVASVALAALSTESVVDAQTSQIASDGDSSCAILNGVVRCWGSGAYGQLGNGAGTQAVGGGSPSKAVKSGGFVNLGAKGAKAIAVTAGTNFHCALLATKQIKCWGRNNVGQLGIGSKVDKGAKAKDMGDKLPAVQLGKGFIPKTIVSGYDRTCAIDEQDQAKCWGLNAHGQLGLNDLKNRGTDKKQMGNNLPKLKFGEDAKVLQLGLGLYHSCAIFKEVAKTNPSTVCWGKNVHGQLGIGNQAKRSDHPKDVPQVSFGSLYAVSITAGGSHSCAILNNGDLKCWGANEYGQLGISSSLDIGDEAGEMDVLKSADLGKNLKALQVQAQLDRTCAIVTGNKLKCWGRNLYGELGQGIEHEIIGDEAGEMGDSLKVIQSDVLSVALGEFFTCVRITGGKVKCTGYNLAGQLGLDDTTGSDKGTFTGEIAFS